MREDFAPYADEVRRGLAADSNGLYIAGQLSGVVYLVSSAEAADGLHNHIGGCFVTPRGKWTTEPLRDRTVVILTRNRPAAEKVAAMLYDVAKSVLVADLPWDVANLIAEHSPAEVGKLLVELSRNAPEWGPKGRTAKPASSFGEDNTRFLWYPYLPIGDYSVMMADGGTGKTVLCCGIAAAVSTGNPLPGEAFQGEGKRVLMISAEDSGEILRKRLSKSGADLDKVMILDCSDSIGMSFSDAYDEFEATIRHYKPALVIIDPWHAFLGANVDINRVNALRPVFQKLAHLTKKCQCAMILVSHVNKRAQGDNANNAATGSSDFINAARSAFRVIFDDGDEDCRIMVHTKTNYAAYGQSVRYRIDDGGVVWDGFSEITKQILEMAARRRSTPWEIMQTDKEHTAVNTALIDALEKSANQFGPTRFSYEEFKKMHGDLIFGGSQPKRALDAVKDRITDDGYFLKTGIQVKKDGAKGNGFMIQRMDTSEPEQTSVYTGT